MTRPFDAMTSALARTRQVLFEPFDATKYLALGFCVWLSRLGSVGASSPGAASRRGWEKGGLPADLSWREMAETLVAWGPLIFAIGAGVLLVGLLVWGIVVFLQSRGTFLVIDNLVKDRGAITEPWTAWAPEANALFRFRIGLAVLTAVFVLPPATVAGIGVWATWTGPHPSVPQVVIVAVAGAFAALVALVASVADGCATEFVAPLMYARRCTVRQAFSDLWGFVRADVAGFAVYLVLRFATVVVVGAMSGLLFCLTCGLVLVPFVGTLILLPLLLFVRTFSLAFVGQLSDDLGAVLGQSTTKAAP